MALSLAVSLVAYFSGGAVHNLARFGLRLRSSVEIQIWPCSVRLVRSSSSSWSSFVVAAIVARSTVARDMSGGFLREVLVDARIRHLRRNLKGGNFALLCDCINEGDA